MRPTLAEVDLDAVAANVGLIRERCPNAALCAVVKADGYGHGAVPVAETVLAAGAEWLAVALVEEARELREAGIDAPILLLSEPPPDAAAEVVALDVRPTVYSAETVDRLGAVAGGVPPPIHLKVDTGMHRVGAAPGDVVALARRALDAGLELEGVWSHFAVADDPADPFTTVQVDRFDDVLGDLAAAGIEPRIVHLANSAGALAHPASHRDLVRVGIALYGVAPSPPLAGALPLAPALSLRSAVSWVKRVEAGEGISYGLTHRFERDATVATVPIGYADGVARRLSAAGGEVLVGGRRRPIVGVVTMDQLMVDCGDDRVARGDEVVLIGVRGDERVTAEEWADRLGTIGYEIVCGIGRRVPRHHVGGP